MLTEAEQEKQTNDNEEIDALVKKITEQSQRLSNEALAPNNDILKIYQHLVSLGQDFQKVADVYFSDPLKLVEMQANYWGKLWQLWAEAAQGDQSLNEGERKADQKTRPNLKFTDPRFADEAWHDNGVFELIKDGYLLFSEFVQESIKSVDTIDEKSSQRLQFFTRQALNAISPSNYYLTNPNVLSELVDTKGKSLLKGLSQMLDDIEKGDGKLNISMTDEAAFSVGDNIATTPGKVVFQNELFQLIQYEPTTKKVHAKPMLIVPPWINKYYILDLRESNSLVAWLRDQGHTTFVISWVNPDASLAHITFEDYVTKGTLAAIEAVKAATGEPDINAAGYCIGGTLLAITLAYLKAVDDESVVSASFFATLLDFSDPGEIGVFIDEEQICALERDAAEKGYFSGETMSLSFNMLRENDLIWSYYINNYLLGKDPMPFDLLYWNSDYTNLPAKMHSYYLRNMYLDNQLIEPNALTIAGEKIDLSQVSIPLYFISTEQDHIAKWQSTYLGAKLFSAPVRFVLGGSGHIAGIINAPAKNKYGFRTNDSLPSESSAWLESSEMHEGSWWLDWNEWLTKGEAPCKSARKPGSTGLSIIEDAPGSYVQKRIRAKSNQNESEVRKAPQATKKAKQKTTEREKN